MSVHESAIEIMKRPRNLEYWKSVEAHPLGEVIPGLVAITAAQWKFWDKRPLIVQSNVITGSKIIELAKEETEEKNIELAKLYNGDTSPLMVAMEAADELVFLCSYVGFFPDDMEMWKEVGGEATVIAQGAIHTLNEMLKKSKERRGGQLHAELLSDIPKFVAESVIADKNESNYNEAYFVPAPPKYGKHGESMPVDKQMVSDLYDRARAGARMARNAIKRQGLYTPYGMPNHLGMFTSLNGRTPEPYNNDEAIVVLQTSLRDHYRYYAKTFGEVGVDFLMNYFRVNNPPMMEVVSAALAESEEPTKIETKTVDIV